MFCKIGVLNNFTKFAVKHLCWSLFFNKEICRRYFPVNFVKFLRILFYRTTPGNCFCSLYLYIKRSVLKIQDDVRYEIVPSVRNQLKVFDEIDEVERKHRESREREMLMRVAKVSCDILKVRALENQVLTDGYLKRNNNIV